MIKIRRFKKCIFLFHIIFTTDFTNKIFKNYFWKLLFWYKLFKSFKNVEQWNSIKFKNPSLLLLSASSKFHKINSFIFYCGCLDCIIIFPCTYRSSINSNTKLPRNLIQHLLSYIVVSICFGLCVETDMKKKIRCTPIKNSNKLNTPCVKTL